jgi:hypothetical protein
MHAIALWRSDGVGFFWCSNKDPVIYDFDGLPDIQSWPTHDLWGSVGISREAVGSAPTESWVPVVVHDDGVGDSVWRSDVALLNRSSRRNEVRIRYYGSWIVSEDNVELAPGESRVISDVVGSLGRDGSGTLQVFSSEALTVTSRAFNRSSHGTFGQTMDSVTATGGLEAGESAVLMQLREDHAGRTNIGIHNQWPRFSRVDVELFSDDGSLVHGDTWIVPPLHTLQINRPFRTFGGSADIDSGYAVITVRSGQEIYAYGSVIDNATGDPTTIAMKTGDGSLVQWVAAASHGAGAHGSVWRTDLALLNLSGVTTNAEIVFHGSDGATASLTARIPNGRQIIVGDAVGQLGMVGPGSLEIRSEQPLLASSRTFNTGSNGTFGLSLDGVPKDATLSARESVWLPQLRQDQEFRTNIGLVNTGDTDARIRIFLFDASGKRLARTSRRLEPGGWLQLNEPFLHLAQRTDIDAGAAKIVVASGHGVIAYAAVVDNTTNDGNAISMKR